MGADVPEEFAVALNTLRSPRTVVGPGKAFQSQWRPVVLPVHHVLCGIYAPFLHPEEVGIVFVVTRIDVHCPVVYHRSRVTGTPGLHKRILCHAAQRHCQDSGKNCCSFHQQNVLISFCACKDTENPRNKPYVMFRGLSIMYHVSLIVVFFACGPAIFRSY